MTADFPPTIIVVHSRERRKKCTVEPLRGRDGFLFRRFPDAGCDLLAGYVRLGFGGPLLSREDADRGLLVLDGTWRWAERMEHDYRHVPVRSLPDWQTAYPRVSKMFENPEAGLATIEAIYAAYKILGRDTTGLLDDYHWGEEFLRLNAEAAQRHTSPQREPG